jgi:hypothetical protein
MGFKKLGNLSKDTREWRRVLKMGYSLLNVCETGVKERV